MSDEPAIPDDFYYEVQDHVSKPTITEGSGLPPDLLTLQYPWLTPYPLDWCNSLRLAKMSIIFFRYKIQLHFMTKCMMQLIQWKFICIYFRGEPHDMLLWSHPSMPRWLFFTGLYAGAGRRLCSLGNSWMTLWISFIFGGIGSPGL